MWWKTFLKPTWKWSNNDKDIVVETFLKPTWKSSNNYKDNVVENIPETNMKIQH